MEAQKWLTYWKKSLSDSIKVNIDIARLKHFEVEVFDFSSPALNSIGEVNTLINFEEERVNNKKGIFKADNERWVKLDCIEILIAPFKLTSGNRHGLLPGRAESKFPFFYVASVNRKGELSPPGEYFPIFQRKYLEPLADEKTEFTFSSVDKVDAALAMGREEYKTYPTYIDYIEQVFQSVTGQQLSAYQADEHQTVRNAIVILPNEEMDAAIEIIRLYEKILREVSIPPLLSNFITLQNSRAVPPVDASGFMEANHLHTGQMGFSYSLHFSQRKALYTLLQTKDKVFTVNGPPGTGKTTLLQSIVANRIVESAIIGNDPPLILACSTNNQAVTNIIDSFSKSITKEGALQGRWLPDIDGYATYLPASSKTAAELTGINYSKLSDEGLFRRVEDFDYLQKAEGYFLQNSALYFGTPPTNIDMVIKKLQNEIKTIQLALQSATIVWKDYLKVEQLFLNEYCKDIFIPARYFAKNLLNEIVLEEDIQSLEFIKVRKRDNLARC